MQSFCVRASKELIILKKQKKTNDRNESLSFTVFVVCYSFMSLKAEKAFELTSLYCKDW